MGNGDVAQNSLGDFAVACAKGAASSPPRKGRDLASPVAVGAASPWIIVAQIQGHAAPNRRFWATEAHLRRPVFFSVGDEAPTEKKPVRDSCAGQDLVGVEGLRLMVCVSSMAAGAHLSPPIDNVEGGYSNDRSKESTVENEISETSDELKQMSNSKPPRHLSVVRHSISTTVLMPASELVFDGHGGTDAASFIRNNILKFIVEDSFYPACLEKAIKSAFLKSDYAFADDSSLDISSGTTHDRIFISGRKKN
ncbi:UNVERIFIED_CONTAM: putative protein phosphatase 2C 27 [Sesamum calycinum]|uniref:PPM-type phosphatase domain-containing protein n=1 Tax=Sesamum calycinum TaxID=2727403 RepID=A0AAW2IZ38_9LAMI